MEPRDIYITKFDCVRLKELLEGGISFKERDRDYLESCSMSWTGPIS